MQIDAIRRVSIEATTSGFREAINSQEKLAVAQDKVALSSGRQERATLSGEQALQRLNRSMEMSYRQTQQMQAANDNLANSWKAVGEGASNAGKSLFSSASDFLSAVGHLKLLALAAYAMSPAFRSFANVGIVTTIAAIGPAAASAAGSILSALRPAFAFLASIAAPVAVVVGSFMAFVAVFNLGAEKIKEFGEIAKNAFAAGVGTDFFQRNAKGAGELGLAVGQASAALKKFHDISEPVLGGSEFSKRLDELIKAGNFQNNPGVAAFKSATDTEERWRAATVLITKAIEQGERLAALDLAAKFLPPEMLDRLRANSNLLKEMQEKADEIKPVDLFSAQQIAYAGELKKRLDDANSTIGEVTLPFYDKMILAGLRLQNVWVVIVETVASAATKVGELAKMLEKVPSWLMTGVSAIVPGGGAMFAAGKALTSDNGPGQSSAAMNGLTKSTNDAQLAARKLNEQLADTSKAPGTIKALANEFGRLVESIERASAAQEANALTVDKSSADQVRLRTEFKLTEAAQQDISKNGGNIEAYYDRIQKAATRAGEAERAVEQARVSASISFDRQTVFLSNEDVQIAQRLKGLYGNDVPAALNSSEASAIRLNNTLKDMKGIATDFATTFLTGMAQGQHAAQALQGALKQLGTSMLNNGVNSAMSGNPWGIVQAGIGYLITSFTSQSEQAKATADAAAQAAEQATAAWDAMAGEVKRFVATMTGNSGGTFTQALGDATGQAQKFIDAAHAAGQGAGELKAALNEFAHTLIRDFLGTFNLVTNALNTGLGFDSPALTAAANIKNIGTVLRGFVEDTSKVNSLVINGIPASAGLTQVLNTPGNFNDPAAVVLTAKQAAQQYAISLLQQAPVLSDVQTKVLALTGSAAQLQSTLQDLGMTAKDAGDAISSGVTQALSRIRNDFNSNLQAKINAASGSGYVNDIKSLISEVAGLYQDASQIGGNTGLVSKYFDVQAQSIVDNARLTGDAFNALTTKFPQLKGAVHQFAEAIIQESQTILAYVASLKTGSISALSPTDQLAFAQKQYTSQLALARAGDSNAVSNITSTSTTLLDVARSFYASSAQYAAIFNSVTSDLTTLAGGHAQGGIIGYAAGGVVGNGTWNMDSVLARFAGGGNIVLAGGEGIINASATRNIGPSAVDFINRSGRLPANDNSANFQNLASVLVAALNGQNRVNATGFNNHAEVMREELRQLRAEVAALRRDANARGNVPVVRPGGLHPSKAA